MRYLVFALAIYLFTTLAYAGPQDKWVYIGPSTSLDGIALLLAISAFSWAYIIYRDFKSKRKKSKR